MSDYGNLPGCRLLITNIRVRLVKYRSVFMIPKPQCNARCFSVGIPLSAQVFLMEMDDPPPAAVLEVEVPPNARPGEEVPGAVS